MNYLMIDLKLVGIKLARQVHTNVMWSKWLLDKF